MWQRSPLTPLPSILAATFINHDVEAYKIHPNDLKNFINGRGVLHMPGPKGNVSEVLQFSRFGYSKV